MELTRLLRLNPTMDMVAEELELGRWECRRSVPFPEKKYRGALPYTGQSRLDERLLYLVPPELADRFPPEGYSCVSSVRVPGSGNRLCCPGQSDAQLLQQLLELFCRLQEQEAQLNQLVFTGGSPDALCQLGQELMGNAVCIHDDWFVMIAMSDGAKQIMPPEYLSDSGKGYVPQRILEEFKFDADYDRTYAQQRCQLWTNASEPGRCLYVNLWEEQRYRGRLILFESTRAFRELDYLMAECLAQRAMLLLRLQKPGTRPYRNLDDIISALLEGTEPDPGDLHFLMDTLKWQEQDQYLCARLQLQQEDSAEVLGHMLHSDLFRVFPGSYIMYLRRQQCLIVNLTREEQGLPELRHRLAPLCRDYCLYAGLSSPVSGIAALSQASRQADIALERAFYRRDERWVLPFSECALDYLLSGLQPELEPKHLAAPEWFALLALDREKDTRYFETLAAYLLLERDIPKTAEALIIHRTTLIYRLKKITALTGLDLDDPDRRLYLLLSLKLLEQQRLIPARTVLFP